MYQFYASLELSGPFMALLQKKCPENPVIASADLHREVKNALSCLIKDQKVIRLWGSLFADYIIPVQETFRFIEKDSVGVISDICSDDLSVVTFSRGTYTWESGISSGN